MHNNPKGKKGFTLIEMLIVVAIIGILAGSVLVGLGPVQRQGRDSRRISDLRSVQNALELYYNKCGFYPGGVAGAACPAFGALATWAELTTSLTGSNLGVRQIPNDPSSGRNYFYRTNAAGSGYVLGATLEDTENPALQRDVDGNVNGLDCSDPVYCFEF